MKKILLLNGPARSGKDTAAIFIKEKLRESCFAYKMAYPLKDAVHKILGLFGNLPELEYLKEVPLDYDIQVPFIHEMNAALPRTLTIKDGKITLREFYIHISENVIKPMFGEDYFGRLAVKYIENAPQELITISDSGFKLESLPLIEKFGAENITLVKIVRPEYDFSGDSRNYIDLSEYGVKKVTLHNDGSIDDFKTKVLGLLE